MRRALPLLVGVAIGVVVGVLLSILGVPTLWVGILAITALMFGPHLYMRYYLPARLRAMLRSLVDPDFGRRRPSSPSTTRSRSG